MTHSWEAVSLLRFNAELTEDANSPFTYTRHRSNGGETLWKRPLRPLGKGGMGEVFREECIGGPAGIVLGTARAVKAIEKPKSQDSRKLNYSRELRAIAQFSQPEYERWFVKAFGWFENTDSVFIAMEFFQHGDLYKCMGGSLLPEIETQTIISQILTGLSYMHTLGYAHRDLKPQNLLVSNPGPVWHIKIADFGLSKKVVASNTSYRTSAGTPGFVAPEVLGLIDDDSDDSADEATQQSYTNAVDIWATGSIAFFLLTGNVPFPMEHGDRRPLRRYVKGRDSYPSKQLHERGTSAECIAMIESLMAAKPASRLTAANSLQHTWLASTEGRSAAADSAVFDGSNASASWTSYDSNHQTVTPATAAATQRTNPTIVGSNYPTVASSGTQSSEIHSASSDMANLLLDEREGEKRQSNSRGDCNAYGRKPLQQPLGQAQQLLRQPIEIYKKEQIPEGLPEGIDSFQESPSQVLSKMHNPLQPFKFADVNLHHARCTFSAQGDLLAVGYGNFSKMPTKVRLYEIATATITASIDIKHVNYSIITVTAIAFSPDGKLLALLYCARNTQRTTIVLLDVSSLEIVSRFYIGRVKNVDGAIQFSPNSQLLAVLTQASGSAVQYQLYNVGSGDLVSQLRRKARYISALSISFSPNGDFAATVYDENLVGIVAVESGKLVKELKSRVNSSETTLADYVAFSPDGKVLAVRETERISTGRGDSIVLYECAGWTHLKSIDIPNGKGVRRSWNGKLSFSPDSRTLAVEVGYYGKNRVGIQMLDVWRGCINASYWAPSVESLPRWGLFRVHAFGFRALSFSADGEVLALAVVQSKPTGDDSQLASESWLLNRQEWKRLS